MKLQPDSSSNFTKSISIIGLAELITLTIILALLTNCNKQKSSQIYKEEQKSDTVLTIKSHKADSRILINYTIPIAEILDSLRKEDSVLHILIDKSDYTLSVIAGTTTIKQYPVVFGDNPVDDKLREGDRCTPEGNFKVVVKYPHKKWSKFILIDYPNAESLRKFNKAKRDGTIPPESTPGGSIGIHGVPDFDFRINIRDNWTAGCISLKNKDIIEVFEFVNAGTEVVIRR